jgi:hypothetical protein
MRTLEAGPIDALHLLLQSLILAAKSGSGLQQLQLTESRVVNAAAAGRDSLEHVTSLALLRISGEYCVQMGLVCIIACTILVLITPMHHQVLASACLFVGTDW